jgi:predicted N-formylglutamate amidohydrolase
MKVSKDEEIFSNSIDAYDPSAGDFASALSERLMCMSISPNFSRLLIDPSLPILDPQLIPLFYKSSKEIQTTVEIKGKELNYDDEPDS